MKGGGVGMRAGARRVGLPIYRDPAHYNRRMLIPSWVPGLMRGICTRISRMMRMGVMLLVLVAGCGVAPVVPSATQTLSVSGTPRVSDGTLGPTQTRLVLETPGVPEMTPGPRQTLGVLETPRVSTSTPAATGT